MRLPVSSSGTQSITPVCHICQRRHHGECMRFSTGCFHYGQEGHFIRECPQLICAETSVASLATLILEMSTHKSSGRGFPSRGPTQPQVEVSLVEAEAVPQGYRQSPALRPEYML